MQRQSKWCLIIKVIAFNESIWYEDTQSAVKKKRNELKRTIYQMSVESLSKIE